MLFFVFALLYHTVTRLSIDFSQKRKEFRKESEILRFFIKTALPKGGKAHRLSGRTPLRCLPAMPSEPPKGRETQLRIPKAIPCKGAFFGRTKALPLREASRTGDGGARPPQAVPQRGQPSFWSCRTLRRRCPAGGERGKNNQKQTDQAPPPRTKAGGGAFQIPAFSRKNAAIFLRCQMAKRSSSPSSIHKFKPLGMSPQVITAATFSISP